MANAPPLQTSDLPAQSPQEASATMSPARGQEMRNFLQARLLQKNRAPPLVHSWDFWHDRQERAQHTTANPAFSPNTNGTSSTPSAATAQPPNGKYEDRLEVLANVDDVRKFWNVFNNFDVTRLALRDSVHLFHKGVKPVWEDARNARGGSWTFRVPKAQAADFWKEVCLMAIGERLQQAVESERTTFRDDVCGVSLSVRFNSMLVQVWNRDGEHAEGVERLLEAVLEGLSEELRPREGSYYYKKHSEHAGFTGTQGAAVSPSSSKASATATVNGSQGLHGMQSLNAIVDGNAHS